MTHPRFPFIPVVGAALAAALPGAVALPVSAQRAPVPVAQQVVGPLPSYADYAALVLAAPIVADVTIRSASRIDPKQAPAIPPGFARFYVTADVTALIRGTGGLPPRISYLADVPLDARGKPPKLSRLRAVIFARAIPGRPLEVQLIGRDAQRAWSPSVDQRVRGIVREVLTDAAPPAITGVGNAFHVAGSLPGEGETQIFLQTADNRPVSLSVVTRPGTPREWTVALSEIVDAAAAAPPRDTLLWYRLACALPPRLPDASLADSDPAAADLARADYRFVVESLGRCDYPAVIGGGARG